MAREDRPTPEHLDASTDDHVGFLRAAAESARRYGLFPLARGAEARAPGLPRIGRARRPAQSVADLAQVPTLAFPDATMAAVEIRNGRPQLEGYWLGLTGAMGPLPTHLSEFAYYERRYSRVRPFGRWLDLIANRMLQLFFRAWGDSQPAVQADRPADDRFARYLAALSGAAEGVEERALFPRAARLHYAGTFGSRRSAVAIEDALGHLLRQRVRVREFQPRWREIDRDDQSRLGRRFANLGDGTALGSRALIASDAFRVVIRAGDFNEFERLMPTAPRFAIMQEALDALAPGHLEWDVTVELEERHARPARLDGRTRLGWTGWVKPDPASTRVRADAHLVRRRKPGHHGSSLGE